MNPGQVARIVHEVGRAAMPGAVAWEKVSPDYRNAATRGAALILEGRIDLEGFDPLTRAVFAACMPAPLDLNEESGLEPDRKPGFALKDIIKRAPAFRETEKPGECEVQKFA